MSRRNRRSRDAFDDRHEYLPEGPIIRVPVLRPLPPHPTFLEEEIEIQRAEIRKLLEDNRRLAEDRTALRRELDDSRDEIRRLNHMISDIRGDHEVRSRELVDKGLKLEADLRAAESYKKDATHFRGEVHKLEKIRRELVEQVQSFSKDLAKLQVENKQIPQMKADIEALQQELMDARLATDYEKKAKMMLFEQKQVMEDNMISMARDVEKMRAELSSSNSRPWPSGATYGMTLNSPEAGFPGHYGDRYGPQMGFAEKTPHYHLGSSTSDGLGKRARR